MESSRDSAQGDAVMSGILCVEDNDDSQFMLHNPKMFGMTIGGHLSEF